MTRYLLSHRFYRFIALPLYCSTALLLFYRSTGSQACYPLRREPRWRIRDGVLSRDQLNFTRPGCNSCLKNFEYCVNSELERFPG